MERELKFLKGVTVPRNFRGEWVDKMSGWVNLHKEIRKDKRDSAFYARLMIVELEYEDPRSGIMLRLKGGFDVCRRREEMIQMMAAIK